MKILFLGPPCLAIEEHLKNEGHSIYQTEESLQLEFLIFQKFDFAISYRYKKIIKQNIVKFFQGNIINLHISYLPWNRGFFPNVWSYIDNTPRGVTIHQIDEGIDTGNILLQQEVSINLDTATLKSSYDVLSHSIEQLFINNSVKLLHNEIIPQPQIGVGSHHYSREIIAFLKLIEDEMWDTPVKKLLGKK